MVKKGQFFISFICVKVILYEFVVLPIKVCIDTVIHIVCYLKLSTELVGYKTRRAT